jgi:hypothetical protein
MRLWGRRIMGLIALSSGLALTTGCDEASQIASTVELALRIVDVWL